MLTFFELPLGVLSLRDLRGHVVEQKECRNEVVGHICQDGKECQHEGSKAVRRWLEAVYVLLRESLGLAAGIRVSLLRCCSYRHGCKLTPLSP